MRILFLSFYFEPDLCAGSFRNTALFESLKEQLSKNDFIHVITTQPNRYHTYSETVESSVSDSNFEINRIKLPEHKNGLLDQIRSFYSFFFAVLRIIRNREYDIVYASSSRLFTAFLGAYISRKKKNKLYLDIRDIFTDTISDVFGKNRIKKILLTSFFLFIERYTFKSASHINLVSEGFREYFSKYSQATYSYFTNGIDDIFLNIKPRKAYNTPKVVLYAGNIGEGQGLEKIIPHVARCFSNQYIFRIIGDGGTKGLLVKELIKHSIKNVEIIKPVKRVELINQYQNADYLFFHLNDYEAFKKVLPSKIFEYSVFNKHIIAGVGGYAAKFVKDNLPKSFVFSPCDVENLVSHLRTMLINDSCEIDNKDFVFKFSRSRIMSEMAYSIIHFSDHNK